MNKTAIRHTMLNDDTLADEFNTILGLESSHGCGPIAFVAQTDVDVSSTITSAPITLQGLMPYADIAISVTGGTYSIDGGSYTSDPGTVSPGDVITVRHTSSASASTATNTTLTVGRSVGVFTSTTAAVLPMSYVRMSKNEGDYLSRAVTGMSDATAFTALWRGRLNANSSLTHMFLNFANEVGGTFQLYWGRVNSATGDKIRVRIYNGGVSNVIVDSTPTYTYTDGYKTFLIAGQMGGNIYIYDGDTQIGSGAWAATNIDLSGSDIAQVGREVAAVRSDMDVGMVLFYDEYHDITSQNVRRQFITAAGLPVEPPAGALIDLRGPVASITTNNGSLGDFTANGTLVDVPETYSHNAVRFTSASSQRLARGGALTGIADSQYITIAACVRWTSSFGTGLMRLLTGHTGFITINKAATSNNLLLGGLSDTGSNESVTAVTFGDLDSYDNQWVTLHVTIDGGTAGGLTNAWRNGTQIVTDQAWTTYTTGTIDLTAFTDWFIGSTNTPSSYWNAQVKFVWFGAGGSEYYITDPTVFYDGGDVDLGTDGRLSGAPAPAIFQGGLQKAADWAVNLGTGGNFTVVNGPLTDV